MVLTPIRTRLTPAPPATPALHHEAHAPAPVTGDPFRRCASTIWRVYRTGGEFLWPDDGGVARRDGARPGAAYDRQKQVLRELRARTVREIRDPLEDVSMDGAPDPKRRPWPEYADAVIELVLEGRHFVLVPAPATAHLPDGWGRPTSGGAPLGVIHVLTAGDPYPEVLSAAENAERERRLVRELDAAGIQHDPALGRSADGSASEVSRALRGVDRADAIAIAARHGQLAIYEIDDRIHTVDVATGAIVSSRDFRRSDVHVSSDALVGPTGWKG
jgi:hypothetical protein